MVRRHEESSTISAGARPLSVVAGDPWQPRWANAISVAPPSAKTRRAGTTGELHCANRPSALLSKAFGSPRRNQQRSKKSGISESAKKSGPPFLWMMLLIISRP